MQATLSRQRYRSAALVLDNNKLWITGGLYSDARTTSEYITPGNEPVKGPDLPAELASHCMVQLDEDTIMFLGSRHSVLRRSQKTYLFSIKNNSFTTGPDLTGTNAGMMCGVLEDDNGNKIVVAAGGMDQSFEPITDIQTWVFGSGNDFMTSGQLPKTLKYGAAVTTPDKKSLIVIGGVETNSASSAQKSLYKISCTTTECQVETMPQTLKIARYLPIAMLIPDSMANCN